MIRFISNASGVAYRNVAKPILFRFSPDSVHDFMVRSVGIAQKCRVLRWFVRKAWAYENRAVLGQTLGGIHYANPVGLSAGFDKNSELLPILYALGFGQTEVGSITSLPCSGNPRPWFYRLPKTKSLVVHAGLANNGAEEICTRLARRVPAMKRRSVLNISIAKTNCSATATEASGIQDYVDGLQSVLQASIADTVTLNISCPNAYGGEPFTKPDSLEKLLAAVDALRADLPIYLKMPIDLPWESFSELLAVADKHNVNGLTIGNLTKDRSNIDLKDELPEDVPGGISGKTNVQRSNELIRRTRQAYPDRFIIVGVGGVSSGQDAYQKIRLGADMVELVTGMIFEGPQVIGQINQDLARLLQRDGYTNIGQAVGADCQRLS
ncbi:dihydroorotate dehydrogenase (quinone) [Candidatus Saccharibacteria bacterium]|nr:MAG: dihydroorotate dehydrogenase (quinone) [Candidatus Saccharibacteria bacterium]